jgi:hypothetical protein
MKDFSKSIQHAVDQISAFDRAKVARENESRDAQIRLPHLLSADASFKALQQAVEELTQSAPEDHDVLIQAFDLKIDEVRYVEPHTFLFSGLDDAGHRTFVTCHFTQLVARVVYLPKRAENRVVTGFASIPTSD